MAALDWNTVLADVETGLKTADAAVNAGAALGLVPDAAIVEPLVALAASLVAKLLAAKAGTLTPIAATVGSIDAGVDAQLAAEYDPTTGLKR